MDLGSDPTNSTTSSSNRYVCDISLKSGKNAILKRPSLLNKLSKITSRCLIIVGSDDKLSSKEMNIELKKNIRGSELFFIKQSGHFVMIEQSKKFNKLFFKWLKY